MCLHGSVSINFQCSLDAVVFVPVSSQVVPLRHLLELAKGWMREASEEKDEESGEVLTSSVLIFQFSLHYCLSIALLRPRSCWGYCICTCSNLPSFAFSGCSEAWCLYYNELAVLFKYLAPIDRDGSSCNPNRHTQ